MPTWIRSHLFALLALVAATPLAGAVDFALIRPEFSGPGRGAVQADSRAANAAFATIARARAALARPPGAVPQVRIEGTLPGHGISRSSLQALQDMPIARDLAMAWRLTGQRVFLERAEVYLLAWANTYRVSFNPIDESGFDALIVAHDLVEPGLSRKTNRKLEAFWRDMAAGYVERMEAGKVRSDTATTNWQSHRIKLAALCAFQVGNKSLIRRARVLFERQVEANLRPDGSTLDFEKRDALHYVVYGLEPLLMAALAAQQHGEPWFEWVAPSGAGLERSVEWLAGYARGEKTHLEFANSTVEFDRQRAYAGVKAFEVKPWNPATSLPVFALASLLDPRYLSLQRQLAVAGGGTAPDWLVLLAEGAAVTDSR